MRHYRPVERHVQHGHLLRFRELCEAAVPPSARFIVFDLDRTLHLARNLGEYMGWELGAYHSYGAEHLKRIEESRSTSRFLVSRSQPIASSRYMLRGARAWAYPGLFYLLWGRMASRFAASRQVRHRLFGAEAFTAIQAMPTLALMHELGGVSVEAAAGLATQLLQRFAGDQVFDRSDIDWLRARCPNARIILSSASPRPTVEAAARELGFDDWECAEIDIHEGHYSSPFQLSPRFLHDEEPERITPPSRYRLNAGRAKIERLLHRFPEMSDADTEVVGISDTWNGEDHCWADHFTRVIDVNSNSPFSPLIIAESPLEEIHSAQLLTRHECEQRDAGQPHYADPRRSERLSPPASGEHNAQGLAAMLANITADLDALEDRRLQLVQAGTDARAVHTGELADLLGDIEHAVNAYNEAKTGSRRQHLVPIRRLLREHEHAMRRRTRSERAISGLSLSVSQQLSAARAVLRATN